MSLDLANYEKKAKEAVKHFWQKRQSATGKNIKSGKRDQGNRSAVTAGKNMDGFIHLIEDIVEANGLSTSCVLSKGVSNLTIPGYFRPTKNWDILIIDGRVLVGVIEFKSQVGSFGNNFNNRCEEALGSATDMKGAIKEDLFELESRPFLGYLMHVEDSPKARNDVKITSPHFNVDKVFEKTSYLDRYNIFCERIVKEGFYDAAALLISSQEEGIKTGYYSDMGKLTSLKTFVSSLAGFIAAYVASK